MSSKTIREERERTSKTGNETLREAQAVNGQKSAGLAQTFRDYHIIRQLPSTSTEADIFIIEKDSTQYILKLYRYGIEPKNDILQSIKSLSEKHPKNFIHVHEVDFDAGSGRWFEIQEYAQNGTLQAVIDDRSKLTATQQSTFFNDVARQVGEALNLLHQNNLLHLDIKPSNILLRSMNPLDMVLIDFGIATSLASDMSKKFTQTRGTPMYQSPESYTGGMGRASDWWGLGMILLEIANGSHPFKGLSPNVIAYSLTTEPVNIPESLDKGQRELIQGLLTRNPEKRWNWEQVSRWLKGERGIPQYFEASTAEESDVTPINFMGQQYRTPSELAAAFIKNEEAWEKGRAALMRGEVSAWARNTKQLDLYAYLMEELPKTQDADERTLLFTQKFGAQLPFVVWGHQITFQNLLLFTGKALKREPLSENEQRIVDSVSNGQLLDYLDKCDINDNNEIKALRQILEKFKGKSLQKIVSFLDFYINSHEYYCPFIKDGAVPYEVALESSDLQSLPMTLKEWNQIDKVFIIPQEIMEETRSVSSYFESILRLKTMSEHSQLVYRSGFSDEEVETLRPFVGSLSDKQRQPEFLEFYLHPGKYYCPFVKNTSKLKSVIKASSDLKNPPMKMEEWKEMNSKYILPKVLVDSLSVSVNSYEKTCEQIKTMKLEKRLLIRDANPEKTALASASLNDYLDGVYRLQWGYNETVIDRTLEEFRKQINHTFGFKKHQIRLWIDYLEFLSSGTMPLSDKDREFLKKIRIQDADKLLSHLLAITGKNIQVYERILRQTKKRKAWRFTIFSLIIMLICVIGGMYLSKKDDIETYFAIQQEKYEHNRNKKKLVKDIAEKYTFRDSASSYLPEGVESYAGYNWWGGSSLFFCSDGIRWQDTKKDTAHFLSYITLSEAHGHQDQEKKIYDMLSDLPEQNNVRGAIGDLIALDWGHNQVKWTPDEIAKLKRLETE